MGTRRIRARWRVAVLAVALLGWPFVSVAALVEASYELSGGAAFLSATGPVTADVRGAVLGVPFRQVRTGVASGATSWNIPAGQLSLSFDDDGATPSLDSVSGQVALSRRAGAIFIDFPLFQVGSLDPISIDLSLASRDDRLINPVIAATFIIDGDGVAGLLALEGPESLVAARAGPPSKGVPVPLQVVASVAAVNSSTGSSAMLAPVAGVFTGGALPVPSIMTFDEICVEEVLGACVATLGVTYDFTGMTVTMTAQGATGTSPVSIPTSRPVPLPPALWLLASAVGGLVLVRRRAAMLGADPPPASAPCCSTAWD